MNYETIDVVYRSRLTFLDHMEEMGYDTTKYRKFSHKEIGEMITAGPANSIAPALEMVLTKREPVEGEPSICKVVYSLGRIKQKILTTVLSIIDPEEGMFDKDSTELVIMLVGEPLADTFHAMARQFLLKNQTRVRFIHTATIVNNPLKHVLQPKFEKMKKEDEEPFLKANYTKKSQLPVIYYHEDPVARMLGLVPGDILKITRPSPTSGESIYYRVCK
jgi:DNA-directed RNA polymerase subunit H